MPQFWLQVFLVGLGAGTCSALLSATVLSGTGFALLLATFAPLPIMIAAIGWNHWAGLVAALAAALGAALALDIASLPSFLVGIGLPAWWLGYLALLARPTGPSGELEWYPPGRIVLWCAGLATAMMIVLALLQLGTDGASIQAALHKTLETILRAQMHIPAGAPLTVPGIDDPQALIDVMVRVAPLFAAMSMALAQLVNLWLAAYVAHVSGRLRRPWPDLVAMRLPTMTALALAAALAGAFLPDILGLVAALPAGSLLGAYAALGFAVLHGITRGLQLRALVLVGVYTIVAVLIWPVLLMTLLGLIDTALDLRGRVASRGPPRAPLA
jgi:predicted membrane protein DUF2232